MLVLDFLKSFNESKSENTYAELFIDNELYMSTEFNYMLDAVKTRKKLENVKLVSWEVHPFTHAGDNVPSARIYIYATKGEK